MNCYVQILNYYGGWTHNGYSNWPMYEGAAIELCFDLEYCRGVAARIVRMWG